MSYEICERCGYAPPDTAELSEIRGELVCNDCVEEEIERDDREKKQLLLLHFPCHFDNMSHENVGTNRVYTSWAFEFAALAGKAMRHEELTESDCVDLVQQFSKRFNEMKEAVEL